MRNIIFLSCFFLLNIHAVCSQQFKQTPEFELLDKTFFKWKGFSFNQPWDKIKKQCALNKIEAYNNEYLDYYCGAITDTRKSYLFQNKLFLEFDNISFDQVVLHIIGSKTSRFNYSSLFFIKEFNDSIKANFEYKVLLQSLNTKYGYSNTTQFEKFKKEIPDSLTRNTERKYLNKKNPFSQVAKTEWNGKAKIHMELIFIQERNLVILSIKEYTSKSFYSNSRNWFSESEYDEKFTIAFKEFDRKNGYKGLKFGMLKSMAKNIVNYKAPDILKQYEVVTPEYKNWFYIPFDYCHLMFNKKNQLYDVTISKNEYSSDEYDFFLKELLELFGNPTKYREKSEDSELTIWQGRNLNILVMRPKDGSIYVDFNCVKLDDYLPTDKLY